MPMRRLRSASGLAGRPLHPHPTLNHHDASPAVCRTRLVAQRLGPRCLAAMECPRPMASHPGRTGRRPPSATRHRPGAAGHAQFALACFSARDGRPDGIPQPHARQLLELARAHVPICRPAGPRTTGGHCHRLVCGNAGGGLHQRLRVSLSAPRCTGPGLCRCGRNVAQLAARRPAHRHRHDAAARALPKQRLWWGYPLCGAKPIHPQHRGHAAPARTPAARLRCPIGPAGPGTALLASRDAREPARSTHGAEGAGRHRAHPHPHRGTNGRGRCLPGLVRAAAGGLAAGPCAGRCKLVPGARHAHGRARIPTRRSLGCRGRSVPQYRGQSGRRHF